MQYRYNSFTSIPFDPQLFTHYHYVWMAPLQWVIATFLIYNEVGWSAFLAIGYLLLQAPFQICLSRLFTRLRYAYRIRSRFTSKKHPQV